MKHPIAATLLAAFLLGGAAWAQEARAKAPDPAAVFAVEPPSDFWKEAYAGIKGDTFTEKSQNAQTTIDAKAIEEMRLFQKRKTLSDLAFRLWKKLPATQDCLTPRSDFLRAHAAWKHYIELQATMLADTCGGGSAYTLYAREILQKEIDWRIALYRQLLAGKNVAMDDLYFYGLKPPGE